jgi:hypothetical protein
MDELEQRKILTEIARSEQSPPSTRVTAIRALMEIERDRAGSDLDSELADLIADHDDAGDDGG